MLGQRAQYLIFAQGLMAARDLRAVAKRPLVLRTSYPDGAVVRNQLVYEVRLCLPCLRLEWCCLRGALRCTQSRCALSGAVHSKKLCM